MGEVYRARDTRLDRTVAIKVLPSHLSSNADLRARFEREAKTISTFQHPNICVLHDVGRQDDVDFLVMEFLEGETLQARLARKPLTTPEILQIAIELASALEKAHRSGIIHRDLKPGNVMLTKGGTKLMDFGLAKPNEFGGGSKSGVPAFSAAATLASMASPVTQAGTIVGTLQYMSPEQIQGKEADPRSDIFAFGAMLYEMLTGKRAFEGKSQLSVASAVLEKDPDPVSTLQPLTPPALEQIVNTCLAKDPEDRFQSAHDLKLQLQWISTASGQIKSQPGAAPSRKTTSLPLLAALVAGWAVAIAAFILTMVYAGRVTSARQLVHAQIEPPPDFKVAIVEYAPPALSPDGKQIALVTVDKNNKQGSDAPTDIFLERLQTGDAVRLAGTATGTFPFWSPDGKYLAFFAEGKLKKVEATGGPAQVICDASDGRGGSWGSKGTIVFAPNIEGPLQAVPDGGGTPRDLPAARKDAGSYTNRNPFFLPDGKHFLFTARGGKDVVAGVYAGSIDGGEPQQVLATGSNVSYADGYLFYLKERTLMAQRFDESSLSLQGSPAPIAANLEYYGPRDLAFFGVSHNTLVYRSAILQNREFAWLDSNGKELEHWGDAGPLFWTSYSSGSQLAVVNRITAGGTTNSLWLLDPRRKNMTRLTADADLGQSGMVAADGNSVFLAAGNSYRGTTTRRWLNATGKEDKLADLDSFSNLISLSKDGRYLLVSRQDVKNGFDIQYMDVTQPPTNQKFTPILSSSYNEFDARLSPDDKWLAYVSDETGRVELYVTSFPGGVTKWQVSNNGVSLADVFASFEWSADSKSLRYKLGDKIYGVDVRDNGGRLEFSPVKELFSLPQDAMVITILPDGKRTLIAKVVGTQSAKPMELVLNWRHLVQ